MADWLLCWSALWLVTFLAWVDYTVYGWGDAGS